MNDEPEITPEDQSDAEIGHIDADELRYAPPLDEGADDAALLDADEAQTTDDPDAFVIDGEVVIIEARDDEALVDEAPIDDDAPTDEAPIDDGEADEATIETEDEKPATSTRTVTGELDVEAALAAISRLTEDRPIRRRPPPKAEQEEPEPETPHFIDFPMPPPITMRRGSMASVVPGILLILIGVWLTLALNTDTTPSGGVVAAVIVVAVAITFLTQWLSSKRWSVGTLLVALLLLLGTGVTFILTQTDSLDFTEGWPLYIGVVGVTLLLTSFLTRASTQRPFVAGLALIVASAAGLVVTADLLSEDLLDTVASLWPVAIIIVIILWVLPTIPRRRRRVRRG
ncbi:MAG: hypothetical protein D6737_12735 [Chloroflexi bacterium]|nr:MAG: hypothetical protein D6737_12735 [Chloroflexota bacterium]